MTEAVEQLKSQARGLSVPERADFGAFVRRKGFKLD